MRKNRRVVRAFSLLELLVVMFIFSTISLIILANHSRFNSSVLLGSLAYKIALSVREAQVYGLSVQGQTSGGVTNFQVGYGVHFQGGTSYTLFADVDGNKKYDSAPHNGYPADTVIKTYTLTQSHAVSDFCGITSTGTRQCAASPTPLIASLDVLFFRPDPDAVISSDIVPPSTPYSSAEITVASPTGSTRKITIASTGQISVTVGIP